MIDVRKMDLPECPCEFEGTKLCNSACPRVVALTSIVLTLNPVVELKD